MLGLHKKSKKLSSCVDFGKSSLLIKIPFYELDRIKAATAFSTMAASRKSTNS